MKKQKKKKKKKMEFNGNRLGLRQREGDSQEVVPAPLLVPQGKRINLLPRPRPGQKKSVPAARTSPKTPAARGKSPSKTAARGKKVPGPRSRSAQAQNKLGYIENDIVQSRPANHMTVAADVKAWNASEDPVHSKKPAARKPRASSRKR